MIFCFDQYLQVSVLVIPVRDWNFKSEKRLVWLGWEFKTFNKTRRTKKNWNFKTRKGYQRWSPGSDLKDITIPVNYKSQFKHIIDVINNLGEKEKIGITLSSIPKTCLFCGSTNLSKEHIIPDWSKAFFKGKLLNIYRIDQYQDENLLDALNSKITTNKKVDFLGFTDNSVCISCNTGRT